MKIKFIIDKLDDGSLLFQLVDHNIIFPEPQPERRDEQGRIISRRIRRKRISTSFEYKGEQIRFDLIDGYKTQLSVNNELNHISLTISKTYKCYIFNRYEYDWYYDNKYIVRDTDKLLNVIPLGIKECLNLN